MIITSMSGGLGNQMFQYAAGRALADRLSAELRVDTTFYTRTAAHNGYELDRIFDGSPQRATPVELTRVLGWRRPRLAQKLLQRLPPVPMLHRGYIAEPHFHYWQGFEQLRGEVYLDGFWQSPRYFEPSTVRIRRDFSFSQPFQGDEHRHVEAIISTNSVSMHVRRGDFVSNPKANALHGTANMAYYQKAMDLINSAQAEVNYFVFSDDISWVKENFRFERPHTFVEGNVGAKSHLDMRLMSMCKHNIIANSSFSWWAAWLNENPSRRVIAPASWFSNSSGKDTSDLCPPDWDRL